MPILPGKPGTMRVRGQIRAQCDATSKKLASIIAYSDKLAARVPPVILLDVDARAVVNAARVQMAILLASVNS